MSKANGTADELLNLPSGGGSVSGAGSNFSVDLNTGTASCGYTFSLPAGPNGILPPLSLQYSSGSGDGPFGIGWSLGLLTVRQKITPASDAPDDTVTGTYSLDSVGDLVDMGSNRYRPAVDASGLLIQFAGGSWSVTDKADTVYTLGTTSNAQIGAPAVAWLLDASTDSSGNAIAYTWLADGAARLPQSIAWGTYQLVFRYEARPDVLVDGSFGAVVTTSQRCSAIELHVTTEAQPLVRSWTLLYGDENGRGRSLLQIIREQGHAADGSTLAVPDRTFAYSTMGTPAMMAVDGWTAPLTGRNTDMVDLNGDGLPDIVLLGPGLPTMHPNLGGGHFGPPRQLSQLPAPLQLSSANATFADMSGNGNVDVLVLDRPFAGYYPLTAPDGVEPSFGLPVTFTEAPAVLPSDSRVRFLDLNGDGITDVLVDTGRAWLMYLRTSDTTWSTVPRVLAAERTPPVSLTDSHVYLADMTGDGRTDIVLASGGGITYWPARADGGWDAAIRMSPAPAFSRDHDPRRLALVDVDGDGCADVVYVDANSVTTWRNVGAGALADPVVVHDTPPAAPGTYRIVDLLGAGTAGVHFQLPSSRSGMSRQAFLDLAGGTKPYLMTGLANGTAAATHVTYRSSTGYAMDDADNGAPWRTYHPFPLQCVARTDQADLAASTTTSTVYTYHEARYDPAARAFLGFARVESEQLGDATCPTLRVESVFHLGLDPADPTRVLFGDEALQLGALRRKPLSTTVYGLDNSPSAGLPYVVTLHTYATHLVPSGLANGAQVAVPYTVSSIEQRWEREAAMVSSRTISYLTVTTDGDVTQQRTQAQRTGIATADQDITTTTTLATGGTNLHVPARVTQTTSDGTIVSASVCYYDGDAYVGLPEGQATAGLVTRIEDLVFDNTFASAIWGASSPELTTFGYHRLPGDANGWWKTRRSHQRSSTPAGPVLATKGPLGAVQTLQFDAAKQRVVAVTDAAGNIVRATIDARVWQTESLTDANGNTTTDVFDALGRVTATIGPLDTAALPGTTFSYAAATVATVVGSARVTHGGTDLVPATTWIDGTGRVMGKATPAATAGETIVSGAARYNARGLAIEAYLPYTVSGSAQQPPPAGTASAVSSYDALGRITQCARPDGLVVTTRRSGDMVITSETWPGGAALDVEQQTFDAAGQAIVVSRNAGDHWVSQQYVYAPCGKAQTITSASGELVTMMYDLLGRLHQVRHPDSGTTTYMLDACDNQRSRTNATGQLVRTDVDLMNRVTAVWHDAEATPRITYAYLDAGNATPADGITTNRYARLWRVTDDLGSVTFRYDECGRQTTSLRTVAAGGATYANTATYDALGRTVGVTLPPAGGGAGGRNVAYTYGPDGHPASASGVVAAAAYDVFGRLTSMKYANGASTLVDYVANGGGVARVRVLDATSNVLRDTTVTRVDGFLTGLTSAAADDDSVTYAYDPMRRLASAAYGSGASATTHTWTFDDTFALTASSDSEGALTYKAGTHQLASAGGTAIAFDTAGRVARGRYGATVFDAADHLTSVTGTDGTAYAHTYDYQGRRVRSTTGATQTYFSPVDNVEVTPGAAVVWVRFGDQRIAADIGGALSFLHPDALGALDLITDANGAYVTRIRQTPFGLTRAANGVAPTGATAALVLLVGGTDASGLVCRGLRWYDPLVAQFISPDPIVTGIFTIGAWNPYAFCLGNPISLADPSGCSFLSVLEIIGIAVLAAACVVGAIFTGGATLVALGVIASNIGGWLLAGVALGSLGGAIAGELAAQKAGGNIWAGAFLGALLGGATSLAGGVIGGAAAAGVDSLIGGTKTLLSFVAAGAIQGAFAGAGTGLAVGYAGGKGSVESALIAMAKGAAWGATLGALLGFGVGAAVGTGWTGTDAPGQWLNIGAFGQKFADFTDTSAAINSADNAAGVTESAFQLASPGGLTAGNFASLLPNLITTNAQAAGWFSIPLNWLAPLALNGAGFADAVDLSMVADQAGFSYMHQISLLFGAAPYFADYAATMWQIVDPSGYASFETSLNHAFGSASPTNTG